MSEAKKSVVKNRKIVENLMKYADEYKEHCKWKSEEPGGFLDEYNELTSKILKIEELLEDARGLFLPD